MITLGLDTCLSACTGVIAREGRVLLGRSLPMIRGHQEALAPLLRDLRQQAGLAWSDIDRIAVTTGPGSFTGLRVGLAFGKGLALALHRPLIGIGTLEALALSAEASGWVAAIIDAGRGNLYLQLFLDGAAKLEPTVASEADGRAEIDRLTGGASITLVGPGAAAVRKPGEHLSVAHFPSPDAISILAVRTDGPVNPLYLRPPDAVPRA